MNRVWILTVMIAASAFGPVAFSERDGAAVAFCARAFSAEGLREASNSAFEDALFGHGRTIAAIRFRLDVLLRRKVVEIAEFCDATAAQQERISLAGRGDIERFLDRAETLRKKFELVRNEGDLDELRAKEILPLRKSLDDGLFGDGSLLAKSLPKTLTADQVTRFERALREQQMKTVLPDGEPSTADEYYQRADKLESKKLYAEALADLTRAIELDPGFTAAYFSRSSIYSRDDPAKAVADLTVFLEILPRNFSARFNRALEHESLREYDKAIDDYSTVIEGDTDFSQWGEGKAKGMAHTYHYRGRAYQWYKKDYGKAVDDFTAALRLDPALEMVHYRRGQAYHDLKDYGSAQADFAEAFDRSPDYPNLLNSWAWQLATCPDSEFRDGQKAVELATRSNEIWEGKQPEPLDVLAAALAELGRFEDAVKSQRMVIDAVGPGKDELRKKMQSRLELYRSGKPFRSE